MKTLIVAIAGALLMPLLAVPANADSDTDAYLAELDRRHVDYSSAGAAVTMGHAVCLALHQGNSATAVVDSIHSAGFSSFDTGIVLGAAMHTWCPEQIPVVQSQLHAAGG